MYIGWREIRRSAGRFGLMVGVLALLSFMVVMLSALTAGLRGQSVTAVESLPGTGLAVQADAGGGPVGLTDSRLGADQVSAITSADPAARPLGIGMTGLNAGNVTSTVAVFGRSDAAQGVRIDAATAAALGVGTGDPVTIGDVTADVAAIGDTGMFAHQAVAEVPMELWQQLTHRDDVSAMLLSGTAASIPTAQVAVVSGAKRLDVIPGYTSEHGSLLMIQGLLVVISAVVAGAFFAVWTGQRVAGLAVVRAMGAGGGYLLRDGLGQAAVVLAAGMTLGSVAGVSVASVASNTVPIDVTVPVVAVPVLAMAVLGLVGAALALRPLTTVDPLTALNR